ncbi:hypothetical protein HPP92_007487 [Vanilla planifolia]|uniref:UBZ4-type domain-containing protein n=1 Tax=Vanilla planifolia TaxID=51239 RepID=A0A835RAA6_VANPL|nr:hypothetical protein HPP92_007487 [Vanilla planifolia]
MTPNVCPVCRTFSSISNTALNAHMDSCLVMAMNTNWVGETISKAMVKPRKRRLMEDIYATAPRCTLDELERRNGTRQPSELGLVSLIAEVAKAPNLLQLETKDSRSEGAAPLSTPAMAHDEIYVDDEGSQIQLSRKQDQIFKSESTCLRNWQCSKRSGLSKRNTNKNFQKGMVHQKPLETKKAVSTSAAESNTMKAPLRCTTNEFVATSKQKFPKIPKTNNILVEEKPMDEQEISELECKDVETQAVTVSAIESSACSDLRPDILKENHSRIPAPLVPIEDSSLVIGREPSESPASCASTLSSPSPRKSHSLSFDANLATRLPVVRDNVSLQPVFEVVNEGTEGINFLSNQQTWIRLNEQPFNCQKTSLESPPGSILMSDSGFTNPSCGTTALSSSRSFLRLMGKNLIVMKAEEADWLPKVHYSSLDKNINAPSLPSALGFPSYGGVQNGLASHSGVSPALWFYRGNSWKYPAPFLA